MLPSPPIGVPGAYSPSQMNPHHYVPSPGASPLRSKEQREKELDAGQALGDAGLNGVNVTEDELLKLVEELGLGGDEAGDLVKGLTSGGGR